MAFDMGNFNQMYDPDFQKNQGKYRDEAFGGDQNRMNQWINSSRSGGANNPFATTDDYSEMNRIIAQSQAGKNDDLYTQGYKPGGMNTMDVRNQLSPYNPAGNLSTMFGNRERYQGANRGNGFDGTEMGGTPQQGTIGSLWGGGGAVAPTDGAGERSSYAGGNQNNYWMGTPGGNPDPNAFVPSPEEPVGLPGTGPKGSPWSGNQTFKPNMGGPNQMNPWLSRMYQNKRRRFGPMGY